MDIRNNAHTQRIADALKVLSTADDAETSALRNEMKAHAEARARAKAQDIETRAKVEKGIAKRAESLLAELVASEAALRRQAAERLARVQLESEAGLSGSVPVPKTLTPDYIDRLASRLRAGQKD